LPPLFQHHASSSPPFVEEKVFETEDINETL